MLDLLITDRDGTYLDCTLGAAGHGKAILEALSSSGRLIGLDADAASLGTAESRLRDFKERFRLFHASYVDLESVLESAGIDAVDGVLFDLGLSSMQLAEVSRGFAFSANGPLDMRFDDSQGRTAAEVLNTMPRRELTDLFRRYGQMRRPGAVSGAVERARSRAPILTTGRLVEAVRGVLRRGPGRQRQLAQIFQALRIEVNSEMDSLDEGLSAASRVLKEGRVMAVISYHSLEDRTVKTFFRENEDGWEILTRKPLTASTEEVSGNPRARSAKLRAAARRRGAGSVAA